MICECYFIWIKDVENVIKIKIPRGDHPSLSGWDLNPMTSVLLRHREMHSEKSRLCEGKCRDWNDASAS